MNLFYSVGGGLGHLTRFSTFCHTMNIEPPVTIVASSPFVKDQRVVPGENKTIIPPFSAGKDQQSMTNWFQKLIDQISPEKVFIDAFPGGILGELNQVFFPRSCSCFLLARIIKWDIYRERIENFRHKFDKVFVLEALDHDYLEFLKGCSQELESLDLAMPSVTRPPLNISENAWLVIHSGPDAELKGLLEIVEKDVATEEIPPEIVVIYPGRRPDFVKPAFRFENLYPAHGLFPAAKRVYSAAGFNIIHQMRDFRYKHYVMPFPRLFDNQFARTELYKNEFARILTSRN